MAYISTQIVDDKMYYLLLDEVQMFGLFQSVLNGYLRKDNMDEKISEKHLQNSKKIKCFSTIKNIWIF